MCFVLEIKIQADSMAFTFNDIIVRKIDIKY